MKKIFALVLTAVLAASVFAGCTSGNSSSSSAPSEGSSSVSSSQPADSSEPVVETPTHDGKATGDEIKVTVQILDDEGDAMYNGACNIVNTEKPTAYDAVKAVVDFGATIPYEEKDSEFISFGNLESTDSFVWTLYINDTKVETTSAEAAIKADDTISWKLDKKA